MPSHVQGYSTLCHFFGLPHWTFRRSADALHSLNKLSCTCAFSAPSCSALPMPGLPLPFTAVPVAARYITLRRYACADSTQNDAPLYHGNFVNRFALQNLNCALFFIAVNLLCFATPSLPSLGGAWVSNAHAMPNAEPLHQSFA